MNPLAAPTRYIPQVPLVRGPKNPDGSPGKLVPMGNPPTGVAYEAWKLGRRQRYADRFGIDLMARDKQGTTATLPAAVSIPQPSTAPAGGNFVEAAGTASRDLAGSAAAEAADHRRRMRNARRQERNAAR